ncbi:IclR family transcriptional regulator [Acidimangrovimonas sediminis]|uniref:IclR family transcriptional regulator n=1 Tax=Acidimangrovimonas sediminis TaxID=2056283 RepID=UPI0018EE0E81|nr:helix-turn-helix domain-containing protein [Acidimangrovimonas sediminis]
MSRKMTEKAGKAEATETGLLQTLQRGMEAFRIVAAAPGGLSVAELAERLGLNRANVYRIVATLEADGFVAKGPGGRIRPGGAMLALAVGVDVQLRAVVGPALDRLAMEAAATAFLSIARGDDAEAVLVSESDAGLIRVGYRVGSRHPLARGAAGIAILAGRPAAPGEAPAIATARNEGVSVTRGELQRGAIGIAAPVRLAGVEASVGVVALDDLEVARVAPLVRATASSIAAGFSAARPRSGA